MRVAPLVVGMLLLSRVAAAEEAHWNVALLGGYGAPASTYKGDDTNPYGWGFGTRAGYTFSRHAYVGGIFVKHTGTNVVGTRQYGEPQYAAIAHQTYVGPELGWDFVPSRFVLRPQLGIGLLVTLGKTSVGAASASENKAWFYVAPGGLVAYRFGALSVGVDLRALMVPAERVTLWAPTVMLAVGMAL
jgi:hypothetical protein